jgi:rhomboid protease GluP
MDLNRIALWFAALPALSLLWRSVRAGRHARGWSIVSALVLIVALVGWFAFRDSAGFAASSFMLVFMLVPSRLNNAALKASEQQRYTRARRLAQLAAVLHPVADWRVLPRVLRAFELAHTGRLADAEALLQVVARGHSSVALMAAAQRLRLLGRWRELKSLAEREGLLALRTQPTLLVLYLRALGELGFVDDLAQFLRAQESALGSAGARDLPLLYLFAFTGQVELTAQLLSTKIYPAETRDFWLAIATQSAGRPEEARRAFGQLQNSQDAQLRIRAQERFASLSRASPDEPPSAQTLAIVRYFAQSFAERQHFALNNPVNRSKNRLTVALIAINAAVYLLGSFPGLFETREAFGERWAFAAKDIFRGEWWRAFSYLFVHANALHLLMNLGGLWVLGPFVERAFGRPRFLVIYLVAGCAGSAVYLVLAYRGASDVQLVGASGCIMGLLGANAAAMLRAWWRHRAPVARETFLRLLAVVALQVAFDYTTPQVAGLAHAVGLLGGFLAALLLRDEISAESVADFAR